MAPALNRFYTGDCLKAMGRGVCRSRRNLARITSKIPPETA